jgi:hypothetical protein
MLPIERNDVEISKLFTWGRVFEVVNSGDEVEARIYMRLLGDADANRARVHALRKSAELRRKLLDESSDERFSFIKPFDSLEAADLQNYVVVFSMREITNDAYKNVNVQKPKPPKSNASLAKMEKYQREVDDYPTLFKNAVEKQMQKEVAKLKKSLETDSREVLYKKYVNALVDELCEQEAINGYRNMELYLGCYKDEDYKERFFPNFDEYDNLDTQIKSDLRAAYERLNINPDELKKLREATR